MNYIISDKRIIKELNLKSFEIINAKNNWNNTSRIVLDNGIFGFFEFPRIRLSEIIFNHIKTILNSIESLDKNAKIYIHEKFNRIESLMAKIFIQENFKHTHFPHVILNIFYLKTIHFYSDLTFRLSYCTPGPHFINIRFDKYFKINGFDGFCLPNYYQCSKNEQKINNEEFKETNNLQSNRDNNNNSKKKYHDKSKKPNFTWIENNCIIPDYINNIALFFGLQFPIERDKLKESFHKLLLRYHPDTTSYSGKELELSGQKTIEIIEKYKILHNWIKTRGNNLHSTAV